MSAVPSQPDPAALGYHGLRMRADDYFALGETQERYQLVDGVVLMSPRPSTFHQMIVRLVQKQLEAHADAHPGACFFPDVDLQLTPTLVYAPDLVCYNPGRLHGFPVRLTTPPDLVIEVLSPGSKAFDLTTKRDDYEKHGIGEYWTYDPDDSRLRTYRRREGLLLDETARGDSAAAEALHGFVLDLRPLRAISAR